MSCLSGPAERHPGLRYLIGVNWHVASGGYWYSSAGSEGPADPVAQGLAHDQVEVAALQPRQFLGEQGHALPPGARHPGDVRAPEHPLGTERVETSMQVRMQAAERILVLGVAGLPGRLDRHVRVFGK